MPQPLSSAYPGRSVGYDFGSHANPAKTRPALAALAMGVLAEWSQLEWALGELLQRMVGKNPAPASVMYYALSGSASKGAAMKALAEVVLEEWQKEHFEVIIKSFISSSKERNRIAHGLWGHANELPDALLLKDPIESAKYSLSFKVKQENNVAEIIPFEEGILVYKATDFQNIQSDIFDLWNIVLHFSATTLWEHDAREDLIAQFHEKCSLPRYKTALNHLRKKRSQ
jgi:hypothetical protein